MNFIIRDPLLFLLFSSTLFFYFLFLSKIKMSSKASMAVLKGFIFIFIFTHFGATVPPFINLKLDALYGFDKKFLSVLVQLFIYGGAMVLLNRHFQLKHVLQGISLLMKDVWLSSFLLLSLVSPLWSVSPLLSFNSAIVFALSSLFMAYMATLYSWKEFGTLLRWLLFVVAVVSLVAVIAVPGIATNAKGWSGIMPFPIKLGTCMALGFVLWLMPVMNPRHLKQMAVAAPLFLIVLIQTNSAQAIATLIVLLSAFLGLNLLKKIEHRYTAAVLLLITPILLFVGYLAFNGLSYVFSSLGRDMTLTGRTEFWPQLIERVAQHNLWLGYGTSAFWQPWLGSQDPALGIANSSGFIPPHAHNGFLEIFIELGLVGVVLFGLSFARVTLQSIRFWRSESSREAAIPILFLLYLFCANVSESQLLGPNYIWFFYVFISVKLNAERLIRRSYPPALSYPV